MGAKTIDPLDTWKPSEAEKIGAAFRTFRVAAEELMADKGKGWRNPKHRLQWSSTLETYAYPVFGNRPVQNVDSEAIM